MHNSYFFLLCLYLILLMGCEEEYIPEIVNAEPEIVVEGYIEAGTTTTPPYVILTRSFPFYSEVDQNTLDELFVHDASVEVRHGNSVFPFTEICLEDLPADIKDQIGNAIGTNPDSLGLNFCVYLDLSFSLVGEIGHTYNLEVNVEGQKVTASTTIPPFVGLDSLYFKQPPGQPSDTLRELRCFITDPDSITSYYRYFTAMNDEPFVSPFSSVVDDGFFDGQQFEFPLNKAEPRNAEFDQESFGLFLVGDTATIKWCTLDEPHYQFWETLEFNAVNQGPFSSYTRIESNVEGGLGIWGGYAVGTYTRIVE